MAEPGSTAVMPPAPLYTRAPGKPLCQYGTKCYRKNPEHFAQFDHPDDHPYFIQEAACLAPPPPPAPRLAFPVGSGGTIDIVSSGEEDENVTWTMPPSSRAMQNGLGVMKQAALGPNGVQAVRRAGASMAIAEMEARQDGAAAAAAAVVHASASASTSASTSTSASASSLAVTSALAPDPATDPANATTSSSDFALTQGMVTQQIIDDSEALGYTSPGEPLSRIKNLDAAVRRFDASLQPVALMVIGEGMNKAANDIMDPACPSGKVLLSALRVCLAGSTYPIEDILVSDLCLGFHHSDGAKPTVENKDFGVIQNLRYVDSLLDQGFVVVILLVGLQAGNKLFSAFTSRSNVFVTNTYHTVLVSNDRRNLATTMAAAITLAAGGRLLRLAWNGITGSSTTAPTLNQVMCF